MNSLDFVRKYVVLGVILTRHPPIQVGLMVDSIQGMVPPSAISPHLSTCAFLSFTYTLHLIVYNFNSLCLIYLLLPHLPTFYLDLLLKDGLISKSDSHLKRAFAIWSNFGSRLTRRVPMWSHLSGSPQSVFRYLRDGPLVSSHFGPQSLQKSPM